MLSNRSMWRKWLLLFTCWSLISSLTFMSVGVADADAANVHPAPTTEATEAASSDQASSVEKPGSHSADDAKASTVEADGKNLAKAAEGASTERAAAGASGFRSAGNYPAAATERSAGQDRSAGTDRASGIAGLTSLKDRPSDGAWMVGEHGELREIKTISNNPLKRKMVTHDFPLGEFCWLSPNGHGSGEYVTNQNGYSARPWFKKPFGSFPGKFDGIAQNERYVYLTATKELDNDSNVNWGGTVVRFDKTNNSWQYNSRGRWVDISWQKAWHQGELVGVDSPPNFNPPQTVGACLRPTENLDFEANGNRNTFSRFGGNVTSGVLLKDGTYVFGGIAEKPKAIGGEYRARNKMFALKPDGQVVYLGYFDTAQSGSYSLDGNYVLSENGDIYASYGTVSNAGFISGTYKINIDKISANDIQNRIKNPVAYYDRGTSQWVRNSQRFDQNANGKAGSGSGNNIPATSVMKEKIFYPKGRTTKFGAFDISPAGNFVIFGTEEAVDLHGSITQNGAGTIEEYNINTGAPVSTVKPYYATESRKQSWLSGHGDKMPQVTDGLGSLSPTPERELTLSKEVVNRIRNDQFKVDLNPLKPFNNITAYTIPEQTTNFSSLNQTMQIRQKISIPGGKFKARIGERAQGNTASLENYTTTLDCGAGVTVGEQNNSWNNGEVNRFYDIEVPAGVKSPIQCKLVNKGPAPKRTLKFEKSLTRANTDDSFTVWMESASAGVSGTRQTQVSGRDGLFSILTAQNQDKQQIENGNIRVAFLEQATRGSLASYNTSVSCTDKNGSLTLLDQRPYTNNTNTWQLTATIPASAEGDIVCTLVNAKKTQVNYVALHKTFDSRFKESDQFKLKLRLPDGNESSGVTTSTSQPNSDIFIKGEDVLTGSQITVSEEMDNLNDLNNYDTTIQCRVNNRSGRLLTPDPDQKRTSLTLTLPTDLKATDTVRCYVENKSHKKRTFSLFKKFENTDSTDGFEFAAGFYGQGSQGNGTIIGNSAGHDATQEFQVGDTLDIKTGSYGLSIKETADKVKLRNRFTTTMSCTNDGAPIQFSGSSSYITAEHWFFNGNLPADAAGAIKCVITNTKKPDPTGSITILKSSKADGSVPLSGSGWKIWKWNGSAWDEYGVIGDDDANQGNLWTKKGAGKYIEDAINATTGPNKGKIKIANMPVGTYWVREMIAPVGFQISDDANRGYPFTIDPDSQETLNPEITVVNDPAEVPELPFTGGWGTLPYMILGFVLTGGAVMAFVIAKPKKRKN